MEDNCANSREVCLNCKHIRKFHNPEFCGGRCSQPTCQCNCFIESGLIYTTDILDAFMQGKAMHKKGYMNPVVEAVDEVFKDNMLMSEPTWEKIKESCMNSEGEE